MNATKVSFEDIYGNMVNNVMSNDTLQKLANFLAKKK